MKITMIGSGYVGLVSGTCFADFGHDVTCVDLDKNKIDSLNNGIVPIYEPGLDALIEQNRKAERLHFSTDVEKAVSEADVIFIAVGTPSRRGDGHADLAYVHAAAKTIAKAAKGFTVVVTKSTVPVGTGDEVERIIRNANPDADVSVVSNPEFLREGAAIEDFKHPDRIIIGVEEERGQERMREVYRPLYLNEAPILFVSRRTAELTKYAANAFLAMKITFINEMADLCEAVGGNVQEVARGIGLDKRIGSKFLNAGPGYGGSCFPKDTLALVKTAQDANVPLRLIEATVAVNDVRKRAMVRKVLSCFDGDIRDKTIAVLGLTFKPNTDDMRDSPAISVVQALQDHGATVRAFDPQGMESAQAVLSDVLYATDPYDAARGADALVVVTEWEAFRALDFERLAELMTSRVLVDLRNIYRRSEVERYGFSYRSVGRPSEDSQGKHNSQAEAEAIPAPTA